MDHIDIVTKGGMMTKKKYGREHYSMMGKRSAKIRLKRFGIEGFKKLSALGVAARQAKAQSKKSLSQKIGEVIASI